MTKVSVIVPVYNVEKYLEKCLDSIINQTLKDIEIILIDDGSKDNSGIICDNYAKKDNRVVVLHQENQGVSVARNKGIEISKGKYIIFVDADDYIEIEMLEAMYNIASGKDIDCVACKFKKIYKNKTVNYDYKIEYNKILSKSEVNDYIKNFKNLLFFGATWCKLIDRNILIKNNIKFLPNINISEDSLFMLEMFLNVNSLYVIDKSFYNYVIRDGSLTTKKYRKNLFESYNQIYNRVILLYENHNIEDYNSYFLNVCARRLILILRQEKNNLISKEEKTELLKTIRNSEMVKEIFKYISIIDFPIDNFFDNKTFINKLKNIHIKMLCLNDYINLFLLKYKKYNLLGKRL